MLSLAWRNVGRQRGRSLATTSAVALVVTLMLTFYSLVGAVLNGIYFSATRLAGHLQVHVEGYRRIAGFRDRLIDDAEGVQRTLEDAFAGADVVAALAVPALVESDGRSYGIVLQGLDQPPATRQRYEDEYLRSGSLPERDDPGGVALGQQLAENLGVGIGDLVYLYAPGGSGYGAAALEVRGLLALPGSEAVAVASLAAARELAAPGAVDRFEVTFPDFVRRSDESTLPERVREAERALGDGFQVERWDQIGPDLAGFLTLFGRVAVIFTLIFFGLAGFLVANTVYLGVIERVREFGVVLALGARPAAVVRLVILESVLLCSGGLLLGLALGGLLVSFTAQGVGFPPEVREFLAEQGLPRVFYGSVGLPQVVTVTAMAFLTAVLAALLPALAAGRLEPVEAMRFTA